MKVNEEQIERRLGVLVGLRAAACIDVVCCVQWQAVRSAF